MIRIIAGEFKGRRLKTPAGDRVRPTQDRVREAWFSILQTAVPEARVLDLFAGSGALGLEALSRGAATADIARGLGVNDREIESSLTMLFARMGVASRAEAIAAAVRRGLLAA